MLLKILLNIISYFKAMSNQRLTLVRLQKEQKSLLNDPIPNLFVRRKGLLNFHFCIYGLQGCYAGGFYHGVLQLAPDYPFSPPQLKFFTESGRFQTNKPICTSFTNFHKEQWTSAWNVRTMLLGVISFMNSPQGGYGSLKQSDQKKRIQAQKSLSRNLQNSQFMELFKQDLTKLGALTGKTITLKSKRQESQQLTHNSQSSNAVYGLLLLLILILVFYGLFRQNMATFVQKIGSKQF